MRLFIRTEASADIGMGHFMRCFAVAEAARERGWSIAFVLHLRSEATQARAAAIGAEIIPSDAMPGKDAWALTAMVTPQDWLLIDTYAADADYISALARVTRVAVLDDLAVVPRFDCHLLINPAQAACVMGYERLAPRARHLLGPDYALIRAEFRRKYEATSAPFIAVMFGGSDPDNLTGRCVQLIGEVLPDTPIRVIAGPANRQVAGLRRLCDLDARLDLVVDPFSVAEALAGAKLVVTAAGGTVGEVAAMNLPALALVVYDNQAAALTACPFPVIDARTGLPGDLGAQVRTLCHDQDRLLAIARSGHTLVDGHGPARILEAMEALA